MLLLVLHPLNILAQGAQLTSTGAEPQQLGQPGPVGGVLDHTKLDVGGVLLPECLILVVRDLLDHVQRLPDQLLLDHLE